MTSPRPLTSSPRKSPASIVEEEGWRQVTDAAELEAIAWAVLDGHSDDVIQWRTATETKQKKRAGKILKFLVGAGMKSTKGLAAPQRLQQAIETALAAQRQTPFV
uniref:Asn/Gln amidotransferase domain-containing protein n=2 Tax=Octactis speculum TaxID=3111310 RepID=A0A7S2HBG1_9STRA|mmetsp:Transcript_63169/g.86865  ORF Transcript_63169/g.86865 Transcript_63169/m.86865 type:complete len:105 (+) Transcript_63169:73-387(+)